MYQTLNNIKLAQLETHFVLPVIIGQMMQGLEPLDQVTEFTIHDMLAKMEPDTAFLCIALCAQKIAHAHAHIPIAAVMGIESGKLMEEYAPLWLTHAAGIDVDEYEVRDLLENLPEDFESLGVLLKTTQISFHDEKAVPALLCNILSFHAESFRDYTEDYFQSEEEQQERMPSYMAEDNVIAFPKVSSHRA